MGDSVDQNAISQITEMGFSTEEAIAALKATDGDVQNALNYIFNPVQEQQPQSENIQHHSYPEFSETSSQYETLAPIGTESQHHHHRQPPVGLPPSLPKRPTQDSLQPVHIENINRPTTTGFHYEDDDDEDDDDSNINDENNRENNVDMLDTPEYSDYTVYNDIHKYVKPENSPAVLMPVVGGSFESYLNPILTIFHQIPSLRKAVFHYEFKTLGYQHNWFKGETINLDEDVTTIQKDKEKYDLRFLLEIQRIFGFLDETSERSFASMKNFLKAFPQEFKASFGNIDNIRSAYDSFYRTLAELLKQAGVANGAVELFESSTHSADEDSSSRKFGMFHVEAEEIEKNLYKTIHGILWGSPIDTSQTISELSDIITIGLEAPYGDMLVPSGIEIPEEFYPQIYTTEFQPIIDDIISKQKSYEEKRRFFSTQLLKTRVHNGKNISDNLHRSIKFLDSESNEQQDTELLKTVEELKNIEINLSEKKARLIEQQQYYQDLKQTTNPLNINLILKNSEETLEPYVLTGVIFKPTMFAYAKVSKDPEDEDTVLTWNYVEYDDNGKDFSTRLVEFDMVKRAVYNFTSTTFEDTIVLVYVKESKLLEEEDIPLPDSVKEFVTKDNEELEKLLRLLSDSESDSELEQEREQEPELEQEEELIDLDSDNISVEKASD